MPTQRARRLRKARIAEHIKEIIKILGYNIKDVNLRGTPKRVASIFMEELDLETLRSRKILKKLYSTTPTLYKSMVILRGHKTQTRCPHHLERVNLNISVGYIPDKKLLGLSKLARIANYYSSGLMLQEEIAESIASGLYDALEPKGVAVTILAEHDCIRCRGVRSQNSDVVTSEVRGVFLEDPATREEFLRLVGGKNER